MTGMERNSDMIVMASYAPLLVNVNPGGMQWRTDLIGYDALTSYGSPSYYAQVIFSNHVGKEIVDSTVSGGGPRFFYSATEDSDKGVLYLKLVNASSIPQPVDIQLGGAKSVGGKRSRHQPEFQDHPGHQYPHRSEAHRPRREDRSPA